MDLLANELLRTESLTEKAYRALEEEIVTLRIPPGTVVSEAILSRRLGLGRTPVREALQRLVREWLVVVVPRRGVVVSDIDPVRQIRLLEARREVERYLVRSAAHHATCEQRAALTEIAAGMDRVGESSDELAFMRLDRDFNLLVLEASNNEFAAATMSQMAGLSRRFWYRHGCTTADLSISARLHADLARAIAKDDGDAAAAAVDALVDYMQGVARAVIG